MTEPCQRLPWDSDFFGYQIARYQGSQLDPQTWKAAENWCRNHQIECMYLLADPNDSQTCRTAEDAGFRFVDIRLTLGRELKNWESSLSIPDGTTLRSWQDADLPNLERIARMSFTQTRFFFDPNFAPEKSTEMYAVWVRKSCQGRAQAVIVAEINAVAVGFITCKLESGASMGEIELIGVSEHARGYGLGGALVSASLDWFKNHGATKVQVVTQGRNLEGQRLYQRRGFTSHAIQIWYHKWFRK